MLTAYIQSPPVEKLTSEAAILTAVFVAATLVILKLLPAIISSLRGDGNGKEKERADQILTALLASTAAKENLSGKIEREVHESAEARNNLHALRDGFAAFQVLALKLVEHLEAHRGQRLSDERELLDQASEALQRKPRNRAKGSNQ